MEDEGLVIEDEFDTGHSEPADRETEPLLRPTPPTYERFRDGRETQQSSRCIRLILAVFQVSFCLLGLWGHRPWNNIPRVLIVIVCIYYIIFVANCNPLRSCNLTGVVNQIHCQNYKIGYITVVTFAAASIVSSVAFIVCCMKAKRNTSAVVFPSQSLVEDIRDKADIFILFLSFLIGNVLLTSLVVLNVTDQIESFLPPPEKSLSFCNRTMSSGDATQVFLHWVSLNICHIFAASCLALGVFAQDARRLIRDLKNGTLDDVIEVHEDQCTAVFDTLSVYSVWFVVHMSIHCAGIIMSVITMCVVLEILADSGKYETKTMNVVFPILHFLFFLHLLLLPIFCAARITSHCSGIYEEINRSTSHYWNESHPFKDRHNIALFISYAKERKCGFKIGRITFDTSLAWLSLLLGLMALLYPVIQQGYQRILISPA